MDAFIHKMIEVKDRKMENILKNDDLLVTKTITAAALVFT